MSLSDLRLYECPLTYITPETWEVIRMVYLMEDSKQLLFDGGWSEQPYWLIEAVQMYKAELARQMKNKDNG